MYYISFRRRVVYIYYVSSAGRPLIRPKRYNVSILSTLLSCIWTECPPVVIIHAGALGVKNQNRTARSTIGPAVAKETPLIKSKRSRTAAGVNPMPEIQRLMCLRSVG